MKTSSEKKYIGSGEDAIVPAFSGSAPDNKKEGEYNPFEDYQQQTEEEACCSATGE